jgi:hypothetical protein
VLITSVKSAIGPNEAQQHVMAECNPGHISDRPIEVLGWVTVGLSSVIGRDVEKSYCRKENARGAIGAPGTERVVSNVLDFRG